MDKSELLERLRDIVEKEQEIYALYTNLANDMDDGELKDLLGWIAHEAYSHLNTIMEKYQNLCDQ